MPTMPPSPQPPDPARNNAGSARGNQSPYESPSAGEPAREIEMPAWIEQAIEQSQSRAARPESTGRSPVTGGPNVPPGTAGASGASKAAMTPPQASAGGPPPKPGAPPQTPAPSTPARPAAPPPAPAPPGTPSGAGGPAATPPGRIAPHPSAPGTAPAKPTYISSRLREKIMEAEDTVEKEAQPMRPLLIGGGIVLVLVVFGLLAWSMGMFGGKPEPKRPATPGATAPATEPATGTTAETPPTTPPGGGATQPGSTTPGTTTPGATATTPAATPAATTPPAATAAKPAAPAATAPKPAATAPAAAAPAVKRIYGLAIGTFLDETRAKEKADQIGAATGLPGRVMTVKEGGTDVYRAVVGRFDSKGAAEGAAVDVISKGATEARVVQVGTEK